MPKVSRLKEILWVFAALGLVALVSRLAGGLGASTDLSDAMPWGLWKILNMVAGVALATGGFTLAAIVYVFNIEKYKSVLKPAIVVAFLGYGASCFALFLDIGLPHTIWHPILFWNPHSFLFEVAWCVMLYFSVTALEVAPVVAEKFNRPGIVRLFHRVTIPIVIVGITLSTLHHTSLGSLFLVMPARLHELWFTSWLPIHFFLSAAGTGIMTVILVTLAYACFFEKQENLPVLTGLSRISASILALYLLTKIADLLIRGALPALFAGTYESYFYLMEILLGALIPIALVAHPKVRRSRLGLVTASISAVLGLCLNRLNVGIIGLLRTSDVRYFPTLPEISLSLGIVAASALVFLYMVEQLKIFDLPSRSVLKPALTRGTQFDRLTTVWTHGFMTDRARISLLMVIVIPLGVGVFGAQALQGVAPAPTPVHPPRGIDTLRSVLEINGNQNEDFVRFAHQLHKDKLGGEESCRKCHHLNLPNDNSSSCSQCHRDMYSVTPIFNHAYHEQKLGKNDSCARCHDMALPKNLHNSKRCIECHEKDMAMVEPPARRFNHLADAYYDVMHQLCIDCHKETALKVSRPEMTECAHCHREAWEARFKSPAESEVAASR